MSSHALTTFTGARAFADDVQGHLTRQFNNTGHLGCCLILLMTRDPDTGLLLPNSPVATRVAALPAEIDSQTGRPTALGTDPFCSPAAKSAFSIVIRQLAARSDSVGLLLAYEAWLVTGTPYTPVDTSIAPSAHPDRQEVVLLTLQHQGGSALWQAPILRNIPDDGRPSLGAFVELPLQGLTGAGQFWNLLPHPPQYN